MLAGFAALLLTIAPSAASQVPQAAPASHAAALDELVGEWELHDPSGAIVGRSRVIVQSPGAMLYEQRLVGDGPVQLLWFANSERNGGWTQLFVGVSGQIREFRTLSSPGARPLIMGADVRLGDGSPARFRMTLNPLPGGGSRRVLEMSRDDGGSWNIVFDYTYRRLQD